ncbi:MAG: hypothetical protein V1790_17500 [Planctomycetota bacterium]
MTSKNENGERFISIRWAMGILAVLLMSVMGGWAMQRHAAEAELFTRLAIVEKVQAGVLERLDSNARMLERIYQELKEHRQTGK